MPDGARWYALRTQPRREAVVWEQAQARGIETFYPRLRARPVNPRARKVQPYFPGYLFVRADLEQTGQSVFDYMPYSAGLVAFGGEPAHVPESLIHGLQRTVTALAERGEDLQDRLKKNDRVWIQAGPFAGHEAIFDTRLQGGERVRLLLQMLSGQRVPIELDAAQVEASRRN
jgi:transcriptional antiterminator RfaH